MAAIGTTLVAMNFGAFGSVPVFLKPLSAEFAWPRGAISLAYTIGTLAIASGGIVWARLADRRGTRPVVLVGALAQAAALFLLSGLGSLPRDMALPGLNLHPLKGARKGTWAVSVSGNWRVTFKFVGKDADSVDYEDYH